MPRIRTEFLKQGLKLGEDIRDKEGRTIMAKGSTLDNAKISKLKENNVYCPEIFGISEEEIDEMYHDGVSDENSTTIEGLHSMQFSMCVGFDPFVKELKIISDRALYASLKS